MKKEEKLFDAIGEINEAYVAEAAPKGKKARKAPRRGFVVAVSIAAAISLIVAPIFVYMIYMSGTSRFEGTPYYSIIKKIDAYADEQDKLYNNSFGDNLTGGDMAPEAGGAPGEIGNYEEVTDNQTEGVIEGDKYKRTDKYIFHLSGTKLSAYSIAGEGSTRVGSYDLANDMQLRFNTASLEMYLFADEGTAAIVGSGSNSLYNTKTGIILLDVSDPSNITRKYYSIIDGSYISSRIADGRLLVMTDYYINYKAVDYDRPETFIPTIISGNGKSFVPPEAIVSPDKLTSTRYTVISAFNTTTLSPEGFGAFLSYSDTVYVSENNIYATRTYSTREQNGNRYKNRVLTDVSIMNFRGDGFKVVGTIPVEGRVKDRFSLDEYEGMLRVVTTISESEYIEYSSSNGSSSAGNFKSNISASLFIYDLETLSLLASDECFSPQGETVQSVRFNKNEAYVCTAIVFTDPVFFFDLSDITDIKRKDTGTVSGYSSSLIKFGDFLLGVGYEDWSNVKIEVYEETETGVRSVDRYIKEYSTIPSEYKCYYINRDECLLGIAITTSYYDIKTEYILLHFDGYKLIEMARVHVDSYLLADDIRGVLIDGYLYVLSNGLDVVKINT